MPVLIAALFVLVALAALALGGLSVYAYLAMFRPKMVSLQRAKEEGLLRGDFDESFLSLPWEDASAEGPGGVRLGLKVLPASGPAAGSVVFVHGITWNRYGMMKYAKVFHERKWNAVLLDLPCHGSSGGDPRLYPAFGYLEKDSVVAAARWAASRFPASGLLGLVGESMGAATVLMAAPALVPLGSGEPGGETASPSVDFIIADCPYSSAGAELLARMAALRIPGFAAALVARLVSALLLRLRGFRLEDASPERAVMESPVPILFIHGGADDYVPTAMSIGMAARRRAEGSGPTELLVVPGAKHGRSIVEDPGAWTAAAFDFIARVDRTRSKST